MTDLDFTVAHHALFAALGVVSGFINVMAGGGTLITMPALIFFGMSPAVSNGTNRIALVLQNITAFARFRKRGFSDLRLGLTLSACTIPGTVAGVIAAVRIDPDWFKRALAVVMILVLIATLAPPRKTDPGNEKPERPPHLIAAHLCMIGIGLYGGFIQAGVGFLLMPVLRRTLSLDLVRVNAHKVLIVGVYTVPALALFAWQGQVHWPSGLSIGIGSMIGAEVATRLQITRGEGPIRIIFAGAVVAMAIKLLLD